VNAPELLSAPLDAGTFRSWDDELADVAAERSYASPVRPLLSITRIDLIEYLLNEGWPEG
jgi:hypothetical protein